jgi:hypothetical protein
MERLSTFDSCPFPPNIISIESIHFSPVTYQLPTSYLPVIMSSMTTHELQNISSIHSNIDHRSNEAELQPDSEESPNSEIEMRSLPPTDHGRQAYLVLAGCTLIQAPVWGEHLLYH